MVHVPTLNHNLFISGGVKYPKVINSRHSLPVPDNYNNMKTIKEIGYYVITYVPSATPMVVYNNGNDIREVLIGIASCTGLVPKPKNRDGHTLSNFILEPKFIEVEAGVYSDYGSACVEYEHIMQQIALY